MTPNPFPDLDPAVEDTPPAASVRATGAPVGWILVGERREFEVWRAQEAAHTERADSLTAAHRQRASRGEKHPVVDFLFTYYRFRPGQLRRWHPGPGVELLGEDPDGRGDQRFYVREDGTTRLDVEAFRAARGRHLRDVATLLAATAARPAAFGCFGLHEWAMVHRTDPDEVRHPRPLRLGAEGTDAVTESLPVRCSHFDAFRFFTPSARGLNRLSPGPGDRAAFEQPGCMHATMDLYKHAHTLTPGIPAELVLDAFELALAAREVDMRASPYDLGYEPIRIETPAGRAEYVAAQRDLADRGALVRERLIAACDALAG
ncbi:3-methyladenine DNA glycosylase [Agilicoccus flavus]|uniref:3-methyladenine DNA glycosylase n=1 Tax=Agilicoccus flavus TaxID=2775968 RepID=UPI001CF6F3CE|nr:3-methyladenine DNA glycosylase [Agilicoccus flavus]